MSAKSVDIHNKRYSRFMFVLVILFATFAGMLMQTSLGTALPTLMDDFHINLATAQEATTWFLLANGIMIPVSAYLSTKFPTKKLYIFAFGLLLVGQFISYSAPVTNWTWFLIGRIIQAISVGITMPLMQVVLVYIFPAEKRGAAMGLSGLVIGMAPAIGPTLSGWILDSSHSFASFTLSNSWRSIFLLPMAVIALTFLLSFIFLRDVIPNQPVHLDFRSLVQSTLGFGLFLWGLTNVANANYGGWTDMTHVIIPGAVGIFFIIIFLWHQLEMRHPFLDIRVFAVKQFSVTTVLISLSMMAMIGIEMMLPTYLQQLRGLSPLSSGLTLLPGALLIGIMSPIAGAVYDRSGAKRLARVGFLILLIATIPFLFFGLNTPRDFITVFYSLRMFGIAMVMMPLTASAMSALPKEKAADGTASNNTVRQVLTAMVVSLLSSVTQNIANTNAPVASLKQQNIFEFGQRTLDASLKGFHVSFAISLFFALLGLILAGMLHSGKVIEQDPDLLDEKGGN
ncbi:MDR family MFS transporter [Oenococcus kitaharae]|uniref:EmrB/QacA family drug resistance transporter n=1 Tax=Oenococcus kitaharae DSM 17330 TaxID=1045004 RepID=G9WGM0_9LACO|nr:MDR family MFS transporter [Oenococcus kitaharae]EHN59847.1 EmrB/QacA family drug resistance transporter [Oenococcus kitaharae DSM 17330]OEY82041.1 multidrug transporter [Oenococcus kitaharae]OEY82504.1 multidrug transporter [Oenococcus kitaharae]OEY83754.1 multidrug transporter [Oenococcus kitaharae]